MKRELTVSKETKKILFFCVENAGRGCATVRLESQYAPAPHEEARHIARKGKSKKDLAPMRHHSLGRKRIAS
jgi:hypothetical protein